MRRLANIAVLAAALARADPARAETPMYYLEAFGSPGRQIAEITWGLLIVSITVVIVIATLVTLGVLLRGRRGVDTSTDQDAVSRPDDRHAIRWIYSGLALTTVVLIGFTVWTVATLSAIGSPHQEPVVTIEVIGHQWWWEVRYIGDDPDRIFETANEIHVPVNEPVLFRLNSGDVIHSFWVPSLSGKTDLIPGQLNVTWLEGEAVGVYRGQCAEYCGLEHAKMAFHAVVEPPDAFLAWLERQAGPELEPINAQLAAGRAAFVENGCGACHTVRGLPGADGDIGPDLTHVGSRLLIAGFLEANVGNFAAWIASAQHLKPGNRMPSFDRLDGPTLRALAAWLESLE